MECLFCGSTDIGKAVIPRPAVFNDKVFSYCRCRNCKLVFINPVPDPGDYQKMYAAEYHETFYFKDQAADFSYWEPVMNKFQGNLTLLDYGCGDGSFLKYFAHQGYKTTGTEYDPSLVRQLSSQNPGVVFSTIPDFWNNSQLTGYNFIHLGDVLEHLEKPRVFLQQLAERLHPEHGVLLVEGPLENNRSFAFMIRYMVSWLTGIVKPGAKASHVPYHITFSTARNQQELFENCGFKTIMYEVFETSWPYPSQPGKSPGSIAKYLAAKISIFFSRLFPGMHSGNRFRYAGQRRG